MIVATPHSHARNPCRAAFSTGISARWRGHSRWSLGEAEQSAGVFASPLSLVAYLPSARGGAVIRNWWHLASPLPSVSSHRSHMAAIALFEAGGVCTVALSCRVSFSHDGLSSLLNSGTALKGPARARDLPQRVAALLFPLTHSPRALRDRLSRRQRRPSSRISRRRASMRWKGLAVRRRTLQRPTLP